jgi:hypothetical protein
LADDHAAASKLALPASVPEAIRDYFDAARMLWVYGWFYYPIYSMAVVHASLCVEPALKEKCRIEGRTLSREERSLKGMLDVAVDSKWLRPHGFESMRRRQERQDEWASVFDADGARRSPEEENAEFHESMRRLLEHVRYFRNRRAHPTGLALWLPNMSLTELSFSRDLIAQLFSTPDFDAPAA